MTTLKRTGLKRTGPKRTGPKRTGPKRTGPKRTGILSLSLLTLLALPLAQSSQNPPPAGEKPSSPGSSDNGQGRKEAPPASGAPNPSSPGRGNAESSNNASGANANSLSTMNDNNLDTLFMMAVSMSNLFEIESSQAAIKKNVSGTTRKFANRMIADHNKAQTALAALAQKKGIKSLPKDSGAQNRMLINHAALYNGVGFVKQYLAAQLEGHKNTVKIFETQIKRGRDADVKAFAAQNLPTIKIHTQMAAALVASSGKSAGNAMGDMDKGVGKTGNGTNDAKAGNAAVTPQTPNKPAGN